MLAPTDKKPGAVYTARWRARQRAGKILLKLEVDEASLVVALVGHGLLNPVVADDPAALAAAARKVLDRFCNGEGSPHADRVYDRLRIGLALRALRRASRGRSRQSLRRGPQAE